MTLLDRLRSVPALRFLGPATPTVAVIRLDGIIGLGGLRRGLTIAGLAGVFERAFSMTPLSAVALVINSPGGAAAQSALIQARIRAHAVERGVPVYAFCEDVAASGGYMLALGADTIIAHPMSLVGSIGVISAGFGFTEVIAKLGIERRVLTAGAHKLRLDPFQPQQPEDVARMQALQADVHQGFQAMVSESRGARLKGAPEELFSGDIWTGRQALELGLVDGLGDLRATLRDRFGPRVRLVRVAPSRGLFRRFAGATVASTLGELAADLDERGLWARYGL